MSRVLVLRDRAAAGESARELARRGHEPLLLPVQAIVPTDDPPPADAAAFAGLVVTSRNAVPALSRLAVEGACPALGVGAATAAALRAAGFAPVEAGTGEAASLLAPATRLAREAGLPLLLALGRRRTDALEAGLAAAGVPFVVWETYDTRPLRPSRAEVETALGGRPADAVLLLSRGQAEGFAALVQDYPDLFPSPPPLLCLSERIAARLPAELRAAASISQARSLPALFDRMTASTFQPYCLAGRAGGTRKTG